MATLRLFVAMYPPPAVTGALLESLESLNLPPHRPTPPDQVHLTLLFIGDTSPRELASVEESVERAAAGVGSLMLTPQRLRTLPERGAARLIAVETDAPPALLELQRRLAARLARPTKRAERFTPHLTLCRFAGPGHPTARYDGPAPPDLAFEVREVHLMQSTLAPAGATHRPVRSCVL